MSKEDTSTGGVIKTVKVKDIKPYERNVRDNNQIAVDMVADSIKRYGYQNPIIVDKDLVVISGHTRLLALKQLGYKEAQVIVSNMSKDQAKAFRVIDNKTNELSNWEKDKLSLELREFVDQKYARQIFPDIQDNVKTQDIQDYGISQEDVEETEKKLEHAFEEKSEERNGDDVFVKIPCPHCSHSFSMAKKDIINKFHYAKEQRQTEME